MVKIDEARIDELVTGDLHGEQYRQLLKDLDTHPGGWKNCALAFLQEQALQRDLQNLAADDEIWSAEFQAETQEENTSVAQDALEPVQPVSANPHTRLEWMSKITSMAALLLISFTIGWFGSGLQDLSPQTNNPGQSASRPPGAADLANSGAATMPATTNQGTFSAVDPSGFQYVGDNVIPFESQPPEYLQQLHRNGQIDLESTNAFVPVYEGDTLKLVPVQHYRVRPKVFSF